MKKSDKVKLEKYSSELVVKHIVKKDGEIIDIKELTFDTLDALKTLKEWVKTIGDEDLYYAEVRITVVPKNESA